MSGKGPAPQTLNVETAVRPRDERLLMTAVFLFWFSVYTYPSFLTSYATNALGATAVMAGMITGSYGLTQMILRIPLGIASDMIKKRKPFVMLGLGLSVAASLGLALVALLASGDGAPRWLSWGALIFRGISGMTAATWVNLSVLYASGYKGDGAAAAVAGLIVMARVEDRVPTGEALTLRRLAALARNRQLLVGTLLATVYQLVVWATVQGFVQNWARDVIGVATAELGYLSTANLLFNTILSRFSGTVLLRRFGRRTVLAAGFVLLTGACLLYPLTNSLITLLAAQVLIGSGVGLIMPLTMSGAIETVPENQRGAAMGFYQAVYGLGMFLGPVIAGAVIGRFADPAAGALGAVPGYVANFRIAAVIAAVGCALSVLLTPGRGNEARRSNSNLTR